MLSNPTRSWRPQADFIQRRTRREDVQCPQRMKTQQIVITTHQPAGVSGQRRMNKGIITRIPRKTLCCQRR